MAKRGKRYIESLKLVDRNKRYSIEEALEILKKMKRNFDETVEVAVKLGIDPKRTDQAVRSSVVLPNGTGKTKRVLVFAKGEKAKEAQEAGADVVADESLIKKIIEEGDIPSEIGKIDVVIATPEMMGELSKAGKILGPKGLMPNPKLGTLTKDISKAVQEAKKGKVDFRSDRGGCVHAPVGKISWEIEKLAENALSFLKALQAAKPAGAKGQFIKTITISTTHSPGVKIDVNSVFKKKK